MAFPASSDRPAWLAPVLAVVALLAVAGPALLVADPPAMPARSRVVRPPARVVPPAELPPVEPVTFQKLSPTDARAWNASVPFVRGPNPPARPFVIGGDAASQARATDCLAAAMLYEAGDDPVGERAVGQVVINRARHPAFPRTICGVVFQGQERATGCQFTFTCDGAMARAPNPAAWERARVLARQALTGHVFARVGHATHYHTDWVVPYWSASLDKIAEVNTHLFFRWTGWWGTPAAFRRAVADVEPVIPRLARISAAHDVAVTVEGTTLAERTGDTATVPEPAVAAIEEGTFLLALNPRLGPDALPDFARTTCGARDYCKLLLWISREDVPARLPATPDQLESMAFSYLRDRSRAFDKALWNCSAFRRADPRECMKGTAPLPIRPATIGPTARATPTPAATATPRTPPPAGP